MATIKSYTDIEQSKKLAEILPLESADMTYIKKRYGTSFYNVPLFHYEIKVQYPKYTNMDFCIPAWSLTALLGVLDFPSLTQNKEDEWEVCVPNHKSDEYIEVSADNPVDACYELILKLKELNLL